MVKTTRAWRFVAAFIWTITGCLVTVQPGRADGLVVVENCVLVIDPKANMTIGRLQLRNNSTEPLSITFSATDFQSITTSNTFGGRVNFAVGNKWEPSLEADGIAGGSNVTIQVEATNVWESGVSEAQLLTNGLPFALIRVARWDVPFAVSMVGAPAEHPELVYDYGQPVSLVLSNADAMTYRIRWDLTVGGKTMAGGIATLPPSSQVNLAGIPSRGIFYGGPSAWFKEHVRDAQLSLRWELPSTLVAPLPREKVIAIRLRLPASPVAEYPMVFCLLILGVVVSWALHITLPNLQRRADLGSQLDALAERTRNLSNHIDSSLRIILRVQRRRLFEALKGGQAWSPAQGNDLDTVKAGILTLDRQISIVERMDRVYDRVIGINDATCPLSVLEVVDDGLTQASRLLRAVRPTEEDLASAESGIKDADARLCQLGKPDDALASQIARRIQSVRTYLTDGVLKGADGVRIAGRLPLLLKPPLFDSALEAPKNVTPDRYLELDVKSRKLELVVSYLQVLSNSADGSERKKAVKEREGELLERLELEGYANLRQADRLVREMQEGIYAEGVQAELTAPDAATRIEIDQAVTYPYEPVLHRVVFAKSELNAAVAREEFLYVWDFGNQYIETCLSWNIWHFYPDAGLHPISVTVISRAGKTVTTLKKEIKVNSSPSQPNFRERTKVEAVRTGVALLAPILVLVAGAHEKLMQQDFPTAAIAIFLMAFTTDTIKNLLTQGPVAAPQKSSAN